MGDANDSSNYSFGNIFNYGLCVDLNLNGSACASRYFSNFPGFQETFMIAISTLTNAQPPYQPWESNGGQDLNYAQQKYGMLLEAITFYLILFFVPETIILIKNIIHIL